MLQTKCQCGRGLISCTRFTAAFSAWVNADHPTRRSRESNEDHSAGVITNRSNFPPQVHSFTVAGAG